LAVFTAGSDSMRPTERPA